ncbi:MAG: Abi family protein [Gammaproteobacteria bacterium]|nr:Abi family protein [Gammaproteobacteria bacterium]
MKFSKPATTFDQQIDLLIERGMQIPTRERARHYLSHLNYYRLGAYWLPFEADHTAHRFKSGTQFDDVVSLYVFDRELRLLVMDAIERLEVSIRTQWAYHLAHAHGPHAYMDTAIFKKASTHQRCLETLEEELDRSKEVFVSHYKNNYTDPALPPIWAAVEVMSLGQLSKWVSGLTHGRDRQAIAKCYGIDETLLVSFLHHLTIVRNICAHHGRLWNRRFGFQLKLPKRPKPLSESLNRQRPKQLYNTLTMLEYFMNTISPGHHWRARLIELFEKHPIADLGAMGFPEDWQARLIWQDQ